MKKVILALLVVFTTTLSVAQNKKGGHGGGPKFTAEQRAQKSVDNLDKAVTLTPEQKTQVYNLALARAQKVDAIRETYKGQPEKKEVAKAEAKAAHKEYRTAVKAILTQEQIARLKEKHKNAKGNKGGKGYKGGKKDVKKDESSKEDEVEEMIPSEEE